MKLKGIEVNIQAKKKKEVFEEIDDVVFQQRQEKIQRQQRMIEIKAHLRLIDQKKVRALVEAVLKGDKTWLKKYENDASQLREELNQLEVKNGNQNNKV